MGYGDKSTKEQQAEKAAASQAAADAAEEDASWAAGGKKANKKAEAAAEKAAAKADRKAAADEQAAAEDAEMATPRTKGKGKGKDKPKLTQAEIAAKAMAAIKAKEKEAKEKKIAIEKSGGNEYIGELKENDNKSKGVDASGIDDALDALSVATSSSSGGGPAKKVNMKALFAEFEERTMAELKLENPGLKLSQLKERAFNMWQKSPENPKNQEAAVEVS